jgi:hypothetical protein
MIHVSHAGSVSCAHEERFDDGPRLSLSFFVRGVADGFLRRAIVCRIVLFVILEVFIFPEIFAEQGLVDAPGIDDDFAGTGLEAGAGEVGGSGLQGVEKKSGGFGIDLTGGDEAHDLHEGDLDGVGVFKDGEIDGGAGAAAGVHGDVGVLPLLVKETELAALHGRRTALGAVDFDVLTTGNVRRV